MDELSQLNLFRHRENAAWNAEPKHLPVTLITGFLGSGKTTLLRHILSNKLNLKVAAAVNDFAEVNVDSELVQRAPADKVVALSNGCICCSVSEGFKEAVYSMLKESDAGNIDYLVVETSGVTDPLATVRVLDAAYGKLYRARLDSVVTVVDCDDLHQRIVEGGAGLSEAASSQLACADVVLLNKVDLVNPAQLAEVRAYVEKLLPGVRIVECSFGRVQLAEVLGIGIVDNAPPEGVLTHERPGARFCLVDDLHQQRRDRPSQPLSQSDHQHGAHKPHSATVSAVFESRAPMSQAAWEDWLATKCPQGMLRMKGNLWFSEDANVKGTVWVFHFSGRRRLECSPLASQGERSCQLVLLGDFDVDQVLQSLHACCAWVPDEAKAKEQRDLALPLIGKEWHVLEDARMPPSALLVRPRVPEEIGLSDDECMRRHGVDMNAVTESACAFTNYCIHPVFVTCVRLEDGRNALRYVLGGSRDFATQWAAIQAETGQAVRSHFKNVSGCDCGW